MLRLDLSSKSSCTHDLRAHRPTKISPTVLLPHPFPACHAMLSSSSSSSSCHLSPHHHPSHSASHRRRLESQLQKFLSLLRLSSTQKHLQQIHAHILKSNLAHTETLATKLISLYSSHSDLDSAVCIFNCIETPSTFTCNIMIRSHALYGSPHDSLRVYCLMLARCLPPDKFTFPFLIKACSILRPRHAALRIGKCVHASSVKAGFATADVFAQNTVMDLYFKTGDLGYGRKVFDKMRVRNVVSSTTAVSGLVACGELEAARGVFERMPVKNVVSWTAMIHGYVGRGRVQEAFELFSRMQAENVRPNEFTLVSLVLACTELGSLELASWIHEFALKNGFELGVHLGTAMIDMYSKCGSIKDAMKVFDEMPKRTVATWNSMITGLGVHGLCNKAVALFVEMEKRNVRPDGITFLAVLCACVNACMVDEGLEIFEKMREKYAMIPTSEHYGCMVELLCRSGMLDEAYDFLKNMGKEEDDDAWRPLLRACEMHGNADMPVGAFKRIDAVDPLIRNVDNGIHPSQDQVMEWEVG
ncbi:hypothetical protein ACLOJK_023832 [Asimina triloba]